MYSWLDKEYICEPTLFKKSFSTPHGKYIASRGYSTPFLFSNCTEQMENVKQFVQLPPFLECRNCFKIKLLRRVSKESLVWKGGNWHLRGRVAFDQEYRGGGGERNVSRAISLPFYPAECFLALNTSRFYHSKQLRDPNSFSFPST